MNSKILGAGILAIDVSTGKILLGRRGFKGESGNTWAPFGGTFEEKDVIPKEAAKREFMEETGCKVPYKISKSPFYINDDNFVRFYTYIGLFDNAFAVEINDESLDYSWFDLKRLPENLLPGVQKLFGDKYYELERLIENLSLNGLK
jgi:8-oxo-dGTP pyrophosphatase MutT (NUDIX family)